MVRNLPASLCLIVISLIGIYSSLLLSGKMLRNKRFRNLQLTAAGFDSEHPTSVKEHPETSPPSSLFVSDVSTYGISTALAEEYISLGNFDEAIKRAKEAIAIAKHTNEPNNIYSAYAEGIWADALHAKGEYQESADHYKRALKVYEKHYRSVSSPDVVEKVGATELVAWKYLSDGDYTNALVAWSSALGLNELLLGSNNNEVAGCMKNVALCHMNTGNIGPVPEALLFKALEVYSTDKTDELDEICYDEKTKVYTLLGHLYFYRGFDKLAEEFYQKAINSHRMIKNSLVG